MEIYFSLLKIIIISTLYLNSVCICVVIIPSSVPGSSCLPGYDHLPLPGVLDDLPEVVLYVSDSLLQLSVAQLRPARGATASDVVLAGFNNSDIDIRNI